MKNDQTKRNKKKKRKKGRKGKKNPMYKLSRPRYKEISFTRTLLCILVEDKSRTTFPREKAARSIL